MTTDCYTSGGFSIASPFCFGCGHKLAIENAWMTDGCPCNSKLGINKQNETRWRLLMQLQQEQSLKLERITVLMRQIREWDQMVSGQGDEIYWRQRIDEMLTKTEVTK